MSLLINALLLCWRLVQFLLFPGASSLKPSHLLLEEGEACRMELIWSSLFSAEKSIEQSCFPLFQIPLSLYPRPPRGNSEIPALNYKRGISIPLISRVSSPPVGRVVPMTETTISLLFYTGR